MLGDSLIVVVNQYWFKSKVTHHFPKILYCHKSRATAKLPETTRIKFSCRCKRLKTFKAAINVGRRRWDTNMLVMSGRRVNSAITKLLPMDYPSYFIATKLYEQYKWYKTIIKYDFITKGLVYRTFYILWKKLDENYHCCHAWDDAPNAIKRSRRLLNVSPVGKVSKWYIVFNKMCFKQLIRTLCTGLFYEYDDKMCMLMLCSIYLILLR